jgi:predicted dienelactone hydrolase
MRGFSFAFALILLLAACGTQAARIKRITIEAGPAGPEIAGAVWYPCVTPAQDAGCDNVALSGVKECPLIGDKLPLIVMSNGRMGRFGNHHDTAAALADAGFVVAAINHPKDNGRDHSGTDSLEVLAGRSGDIKRLIDFILGAWPDSAHVDGGRVGLFGFSMGGYTGLVVIGGNPDFRKGHPRCARSDLRVLPVCGQLESGQLPSEAPAHDPRVRAAVIIDPWPEFLLPADHLKSVSIPVQLWSSDPSLDADGLSGCCAAKIRERLPSTPEWHFVDNAKHFSFLTVCTAKEAQDEPRLCTDAPGFDRAAFHKQLHADMIAFFRKYLTKGQVQ